MHDVCIATMSWFLVVTYSEKEEVLGVIDHTLIVVIVIILFELEL